MADWRWTELPDWASTLLEAADVGVWDTDFPMDRARNTPAIYRMLGYEPETVSLATLQDWLDVVHPDDRDRLRRALRAHVAGETVRYEAEYRARTRAGTWCWLLARGRVTEWTAEGAPQRMIGTLADISERKSLEEALRNSQARLTATLECLPLDLWMMGADGRYQMQNAVCRELWGDIVGSRSEELAVAPETLAVWQSNNQRALTGETVRDEIQFVIQGEPRHFYNVVTPIKEGDRTLGIVGINLDITRRKQTEESLERRNHELRLANEELERLGRTKDRLTAMISHELRTPLVTGLGYVDLLLEEALGPLTPRMRAKMSKAQRSLRRLSRLIDGVIKYQQLLILGQGGIAPDASFDLAQLLKELRQDAEAAGKTRGREVHLDIAPGTPWVHGDRDLMHMVLLNLVDNALKHAGAEATVRVEVTPTAEGRVAVAVIDDGAGIAAEVSAVAFEPFVRASAEVEGYGLGLAVVKAILRAHSVEPALTTEPGRGTRISFTLAVAN